VPESKGRAKPAYTPPVKRNPKATMANPPWFTSVMLGLMLVGRLLEPGHRFRSDDHRLHDDHALALTHDT